MHGPSTSTCRKPSHVGSPIAHLAHAGLADLRVHSLMRGHRCSSAGRERCASATDHPYRGVATRLRFSLHLAAVRTEERLSTFRIVNKGA